MHLRPPSLLLLGCLAACDARRVVVPGDDTGQPDDAQACPNLHLSSGSLAWDEVSTDGTTPQTLGVTNLCTGVGDLAMVFTLQSDSSSAFSFVAGDGSLEPGASTVLVASFSPDDLERHSGIITVDTNEAHGEGSLIALSGQAIADADGDGYDAMAVGGDDCNDSDPDVHPGAAEVWADGLDNDCDGTVDRLGPDNATAWLRGAPETYLGYRSSISVGDLTGDGILDIIAGGMYTGTDADSQGGVRVLDGADYTSFAGSIEGYEIALIQGAATESRTGTLDPLQGDHDGDGVHDLFLVASDVINADDGNKAGAVYLGGPSFGGQLDPFDAVVTLSGSDSLSSLTSLGSIDYDGDGLDDLFVGDWYSAWVFSGRVYGFMSTSVSTGGDYALQWDHDLEWSGRDSDDRLGCALSGGDLDGDGYDDLLASAPNADVGGHDSGSLFLFSGAASLPDDGIADDVYDLEFYGSSADAQLGWLTRSQIADFDGDGRMDLAASTPSTGTVYLWLDAAALVGGLVASTTADIQILGEGADQFGFGLQQGDVDGDGVTDLVVSAPDHDDPIDARKHADQSGEVYVFTARSLSPGTLGSSQATVLVGGISDADLFGLGMALGDLNGDHQAELLVAAPNAGSSQQGYIWIFDGG